MSDLLYRSIHQHVSLTPAEWALCREQFRPKRLLKRQFLLQQGDVCRQIAFVEKGALYAYSVDDRGIEHVLRFAFEGWWIADLQSFFTGKPSTANIEALDTCELLIADKPNQDMLLSDIPAYERFHRIILEKAYTALQQRVDNAIGRTAEEKYTRLLENNPEFLNRVPLSLVASYLGMSPETLSRVRKALSG